LSARFSNSPALHLTIGKSRVRHGLYGVFCLVNAYTLWLLYSSGYLLLVYLLTPPVAVLLWRLRRDPLCGAELRWRQGLWTLEQGPAQLAISLGRRSTALPWVIYVDCRDPASGNGKGIWLFVDSASGRELRQLRVRLSLQR